MSARGRKKQAKAKRRAAAGRPTVPTIAQGRPAWRAGDGTVWNCLLNGQPWLADHAAIVPWETEFSTWTTYRPTARRPLWTRDAHGIQP